MEAAGKLPPPSKRPSLLGWTPEIGLLTAVVDGVRRIEHGVWGASPKFKGKGGKPPQALPRPQTARERLRNVKCSVSTTTSPPNSSASATRAATRTPGVSMADLQSGQTFINVLPSMTGYFKKVRAEVQNNNRAEHRVKVDQRRLDQAKRALEATVKAEETARRRR
ncbi:hypothetical protein GS432_14365 [Rhodococcus hoagii]|nr:hypothetical protein [Prescottella equi]